MHIDRTRIKLVSRLLIAAAILLSGVALLPYTALSAQQLGWELYAGIYQPDLDVVVNKGFPGSFFEFHGSNYPPNTLATVYVDGLPVGSLTTDGGGNGAFLIDSTGGNFQRYFISMSTDDNTSSTAHIDLESDEPILPIPPGWNGPIFLLTGPQPCTSNCLRAVRLQLTFTPHSVRGRVMVRDEANHAIKNANVTVEYTLPDNSTHIETGVTNNRGGVNVGFAESMSGLYTMTVTDITKSGYTFDPDNSILSISRIKP